MIKKARTGSEVKDYAVQIYCTIRGANESEIQDKVWRACDELRTKFARDFVSAERVEVDQ